MFLKEVRLVLFSSIFLIMLIVVTCLPQSFGSFKGTRTEDLAMHFYSDVYAAYNALENGEIDIIGYDLPKSLYPDAIVNPNIALAPVDDMGMYEFDINNNYTIPSNPGVRSPTNYKEFRQALAFLVDKDHIVEEFCNGFATRIDQPTAATTPGWMNMSYAGPDYPYEYDPANASALLDSAGFINGTTPNPYYDPDFPGSTATIRMYPPDSSKAGQDLDEIVFRMRSDDPRRFQAGNALIAAARKIGIPCNDGQGCIVFVWPPPDEPLDYHIYTGGWSLGRFPTYLHYLYHSQFWAPYSANFVHGIEADGSPNHPLLDTLLDRIYFSETFEEVLRNIRNTMGLFTELCVTIPLFSSKTFWAYNSNLLATVNMDAYCFEYNYLFMNAYKVDGSPIKWGLTTPPNALNIMYSSWRYDYQCLNRVYGFAYHDLPPYDIVADQPGFVLDWFADTWDDNGSLKAKNYKQFRSDNYFVDTDGNQMSNVDVDDYLFSCYVHYAIGVDAWNFDTIQDVKYFNKVNDTFVEIFFDARSYWLYTSASPALLSREVWLNTTLDLTENLVETFVVDTNLTTPGFMGLGGSQPHGPCWVNSVVSNLDGTLVEWIDFHWELGDWYLDIPLTTGAVVTVDYYAMDDASGYTLGDNSWEDVTIGCGMYYATGFNPGVGGNFTAKRNPLLLYGNSNPGRSGFCVGGRGLL